MMRPNSFNSRATFAWNSSGVLPTGSAPNAARRSIVFFCLRVFTVSACTRLMMSRGVPAGASRRGHGDDLDFTGADLRQHRGRGKKRNLHFARGQCDLHRCTAFVTDRGHAHGCAGSQLENFSREMRGTTGPRTRCQLRGDDAPAARAIVDNDGAAHVVIKPRRKDARHPIIAATRLRGRQQAYGFAGV